MPLAWFFPASLPALLGKCAQGVHVLSGWGNFTSLVFLLWVYFLKLWLLACTEINFCCAWLFIRVFLDLPPFASSHRFSFVFFHHWQDLMFLYYLKKYIWVFKSLE